MNTSYAQKTKVNYDEEKVGNFTLPKILLTENQSTVETVVQWENVRKLEILSDFENEVYGQIPKDFDNIKFSILRSDSKSLNGKAYMREVRITVSRNNKFVQVDLVLFVPNDLEKPVPVFLLINNRDKYHTDPTRYIKSEFWPVEKLINAGYAVASFQVDDAAPDDVDTYSEGVLELYPAQLQMKNGMKAIGAWAWAASRVMDYFEQSNEIDASKVALVGHSRGGKASLWAGAEDQRFAIVVSNNSGNTGAALSRRNFGETIEIINTAFPHWFNQNYKKYNGNEQNLPVDQHMLLGLIAPRPIYVTSASKDLWADPKGTFLAMKEAEVVYNLYDLPSRLPEEIPRINTPIIASPMGYHIREGEHNLTEYDWLNFIKFADYHFKKKK